MAEYEILQAGEGKITEKKSVFIAAVEKVNTEEEALAFVTAKKKQYYDARHNCFAYIIGGEKGIVRSSDDGEPSGTAGRPILDVMTGHGLCNAVVVVTRYFGGVLLGTGGLVRAYSQAAEEGIKNALLAERQLGIPMAIAVDYTFLGKVQYLLNEEIIPIVDTAYDTGVTVHAMVPADKTEGLEKKLVDVTGGSAGISRGEECYFGFAEGKLILF